MEFHQTDWLGRWNNFESYLTSTDPHMQAAWRDAEGVAAALPMFKNGAKAFWQMACVTTSIGNPRTLGGWEITPAGSDKLCIEWLADDGAPLGRAHLPPGPRAGTRSGRQGKRAFHGRERRRRLAVPLPAGYGADAAPHGSLVGC